MNATPQPTDEMIVAFLVEGGDEFTTGEALSDKLGLSRGDVWKHLEALRTLGYRIENSPTKGYRLLEVPDRVSALEVAHLLNTRDLGRVFEHRESTDSTHADAWALAEEGAAHGTVVIAEAQAAGRGRRGRAWSCIAGKDVALSIVLRPSGSAATAPEYTLVAAVAAAQTLIEAGAPVAIKWPNDLVAGSQKVAGILTELSADADGIRFLVLGLGINVNSIPEEFPEALSGTLTSLLALRGQPVPRALFVAALLGHLEHWLDIYEEQGFEPIRTAWKAHAAHLGQEVLVRSEAQELRGVAEDLDPTGALILRLADGSTTRILAGDVEAVRARKGP